MVKKILLFVAAVAVITGCAKVQVVAPKEPIKVDIAMRLDVYQHVAKDIDAIEDLVTGGKAPGQQSLLRGFVGVAYAEEGLSPEIEKAAMRRKARYGVLNAAESKGQIGETNTGYVELRPAGKGDSGLKDIVSAENSDRAVIYSSIAKKNGATVAEVQKMYAKKLQSGAPTGTPIESEPGEWRVK